MKTNNKVLLWLLIGKEMPVFDFYQSGDVELVANDVCGDSVERVSEVWYSPTGFGGRDDVRSVGFIRLPYIVKLNEQTAKNYKLSVLSTKITSRFTENWKLKLTVPGVSLEHQKAFYEHLFIV